MAFTKAIDVSQWQGTIDWAAIRNGGAQIAIIKMGGGDAGLYLDPKANANYYGAKNVGLALGCYWFAGGGNPVNEADFFVAACSPLAKDDVMVLDYELHLANPVDWCNQFLTRVHARTGVWPLLYINLATLNAYNWDAVLKNCGLWLAAWNNDPNATLTNKFYVLHQYTSNGTMPGIAGRVDLDAFFGTVAQFKKYGYQPVVVAPSPTPAPQPTPQPAPTPVSTPAPTPTPSPQPTPPPAPPKDYGEENNTLLKQILALVQGLVIKIGSLFK